MLLSFGILVRRSPAIKNAPYQFSENLPPPKSGIPGNETVESIRSLAHAYGTIISFKAYVDVSSTLRLWSELQASGVSLIACPHNGRQDVASKMLIVDMITFAVDHPSSATILLISGDRDLAYAISILRHRKYKVVVLCPSNTHSSLLAQANIHLDWNAEGLKETDAPQPSPATSRPVPWTPQGVSSVANKRPISDPKGKTRDFDNNDSDEDYFDRPCGPPYKSHPNGPSNALPDETPSRAPFRHSLPGSFRSARPTTPPPPEHKSSNPTFVTNGDILFESSSQPDLPKGFPFAEHAPAKEPLTSASALGPDESVDKSLQLAHLATPVTVHADSWNVSTSTFTPAAQASASVPVTLSTSPPPTANIIGTPTAPYISNVAPMTAPAPSAPAPILKSLLPTPAAPTCALSAPSNPPPLLPSSSVAKTAPQHFLHLIDALKKRGPETSTKVTRTVLGTDLAQFKGLYAQAGVSKFSSYYTGYEIVKKIRHVAHNFGSIKLFKAYLELSDPATFSKSLALRSELQASGVSLTDCPHNGRKDVADKMMLVDMLAYAIDKPPPSTIILISGDRDFAYAVSTLRLRRYRVVIISLAGVHTSLKIQASVFLDWNNDVLGAEIEEEGRSLRALPPALVEEERRPASQFYRDIPSPSRNFPSRRGRSISEEVDIDVMDYLHFKENVARNRAGYLDSHARVTDEAAVKETRSHTRPAPLPSHDSVESSLPTTRTSSRTQSTPAAFITDHPSSISTVGKTDSEAVSAIGQSTTAIPVSEFRPYFGTDSGNFRNAPTSPTPLNVSIVAENNQDVTPLPAVQSPNTVTVSLPSHQPSDLPKPQLHPKGAPLVQQSQPKLVPPVFALLVKRLEFHRSKGFYRPFRSGIAVELMNTDNLLYKRAGVERFSQYTALAEKAGIIELGGKEGDAWIALHPDWYPRLTTPVGSTAL
ncbi:hypothetical protein C0991_008827 [Blastosporella zonata]|nr:hypothetical protein C0991_008827 [Blastosporella zonata]